MATVKNFFSFPQKVKDGIPYDVAIPLLGMSPQELEPETRIPTHPVTTSIFPPSRRQQRLKCPLMANGNKTSCTHTAEQHSVLRKRDIVTHTVLSEISRSRETGAAQSCSV